MYTVVFSNSFLFGEVLFLFLELNVRNELADNTMGPMIYIAPTLMCLLGSIFRLRLDMNSSRSLFSV